MYSNPQSILITGASSGIGAALARHYAAPDISLFISGRDQERLQVGPFKLADAVDLDRLDQEPPTLEALGTGWIPFDEIPLPFGEVAADSQQERRIVHGQTILVRPLEGGAGDWVKLVNRRRQLIAVGSVTERIGDRVGVIQPRIVFK